jgi:hypothetical protein
MSTALSATIGDAIQDREVRGSLMNRFLLPILTFVLPMGLYASSPQNFADLSASDPLVKLKEQIGLSKAAFKLTFPNKKGFAFSENCKSQINAFYKDGLVERILIGNFPAAEGCGSLAEGALSKSYGEGASGGFRYTSVIRPVIISQGVETFIWCLKDYDIILFRNPNFKTSKFNITVMRPGAYDPGSGKRVEAGSPEHRARCGEVK